MNKVKNMKYRKSIPHGTRGILTNDGLVQLMASHGATALALITGAAGPDTSPISHRSGTLAPLLLLSPATTVHAMAAAPAVSRALLWHPCPC